MVTHHRDEAGPPSVVKAVSEARAFFRTVGRARLTWPKGEVEPAEGTLGRKARGPKPAVGPEGSGAVAIDQVPLRECLGERGWERKAQQRTTGRQRVSEPAASG